MNAGKSGRTALVLAAEFPPHIGGVASYTEAMATTLARAGWNVRLITSTPGPTRAQRPGLTIVRTPGALNRKYLKTLPLLVAALATCIRKRPELVVAMKCNHEGIVARVIQLLFGVPYVAVGYGSELVEFGAHGLFGRFVRSLFHHAFHVIAISTYTADLEVHLGALPERVSIIHPVVEPPQRPSADLRADADTRPASPVILTVARLVPRKGHDRVLEAVAMIRADFPDLIYKIAGSGSHGAQLEQLIRQLGVDDQVRMLGAVPHEQLEILFAECDVFVMVSRQEGTDVEGFGIVFLEAAMWGKPSVAGRTGGIPDAVVDGVTGLLVDPMSSAAVAAALRSLLSDPDRARDMGARARERALREFTSDHQMVEVQRLFDRLVAPD